MLLLNQTLLGSEKPSVLDDASQQFGDEYFLANASGVPHDQIDHYPPANRLYPRKTLNGLTMSW